MKKVLIIDDNELVLETLSLILGQVGITAAKASTSEAALKFMEFTDFNLAICDVQMPAHPADSQMEGGLYAIREIRSHYPKCEVLAMSGDCSPEVQRQTEALGVSLLLQKPFKVDQIIKIVEDSLNPK